MKIPIFIVLLCLIVRNTHQQGLNCYVPADILILLDGSDSIQDRDWTNAKTFVKQLIKQFDVAPDAIHMGIVVYSSNIGDYVSFAPFKPKTMLEIISTSLRQPKHSTNTAKGIQYAREQFKKDGRQGVPKILIVITDGSSDSPRDTHSQAELAKIEGIRILALGVGKQIFKDELRQIASSPRKVYTATSYITLQGLISEIRNMVCQVITTTTSPPLQTQMVTLPSIHVANPTDKVCNVPGDIVFLIDGSNSMSNADFRKQKNFVANMIDNFEIGKEFIHVGIVVFSTVIGDIVHLQPSRSKDLLKILANNLRHPKVGTNTALGIERVRKMMREEGRSFAPKIMVVVTDGRSASPALTSLQASLAKAEGLTVIAIGVGSAMFKDELENIASDQGKMFQVTRFQDLELIITAMRNLICQSITTTTSTTTTTTTPATINVPYPPGLICDVAADVGFVIDGSKSISSGDWPKGLNFVANLINNLYITPEGIHAGIVVYSTFINEKVPLNPFKSKPLLMAMTKSLKQPKQGTNTALGVDTMRQMFRNQGRYDAPKVMIIVTDGKSTNPGQTKIQAARAKAEGAIIITVGIGGSSMFKDEIRDIATKNKYFEVADYRSLTTIIQQLRDLICMVITTTPPVISTTPQPDPLLPPIPGCDIPAEIMLLTHGSENINEYNWNKNKDFIVSLIRNLNVGKTQHHVGYVVYSNTYGDTIGLEPYKSTFDLTNMANSLIHPGKGVNTAIGMKKLREIYKTQARSKAPRIGIVITDQTSTDTAATKREAEQAKKEGITLLTVGIGNNINPRELQGLSSSERFIHRTDNFNSLEMIMPQIRQQICEIIMKPPGDSFTELCSGCLIDKGIGFNPYPGDCTKYVQCWRDNNRVMGAIKSCPFGQFWDRVAMACQPSLSVQCPADVCRHSPDGFTYGMKNKGCRAYWLCVNGHSVGSCCPEGSYYVEGMGCMRGKACKEPCPPDGGIILTPDCSKEEHWDQRYFIEKVPFYGKVVRPCPPGTVYSTSYCDCVVKGTNGIIPILPGDKCRAKAHFNFDVDMKDKSGGSVPISYRNVQRTRYGTAHFTGNGEMNLWKNRNINVNNKLVLRFKFKLDRWTDRFDYGGVIVDMGKGGDVHWKYDIESGWTRNITVGGGWDIRNLVKLFRTLVSSRTEPEMKQNMWKVANSMDFKTLLYQLGFVPNTSSGMQLLRLLMNGNGADILQKIVIALEKQKSPYDMRMTLKTMLSRPEMRTWILQNTPKQYIDITMKNWNRFLESLSLPENQWKTGKITWYKPADKIGTGSMSSIAIIADLWRTFARAMGMDTRDWQNLLRITLGTDIIGEGGRVDVEFINEMKNVLGRNNTILQAWHDFLRGKNVRLDFEGKNPTTSWWEKTFGIGRGMAPIPGIDRGMSVGIVADLWRKFIQEAQLPESMKQKLTWTFGGPDATEDDLFKEINTVLGDDNLKNKWIHFIQGHYAHGGPGKTEAQLWKPGPRGELFWKIIFGQGKDGSGTGPGTDGSQTGTGQTSVDIKKLADLWRTFVTQSKLEGPQWKDLLIFTNTDKPGSKNINVKLLLKEMKNVLMADDNVDTAWLKYLQDNGIDKSWFLRILFSDQGGPFNENWVYWYLYRNKEYAGIGNSTGGIGVGGSGGGGQTNKNQIIGLWRDFVTQSKLGPEWNGMLTWTLGSGNNGGPGEYMEWIYEIISVLGNKEMRGRWLNFLNAKNVGNEWINWFMVISGDSRGSFEVDQSGLNLVMSLWKRFIGALNLNGQGGQSGQNWNQKLIWTLGGGLTDRYIDWSNEVVSVLQNTTIRDHWFNYLQQNNAGNVWINWFRMILDVGSTSSSSGNWIWHYLSSGMSVPLDILANLWIQFVFDRNLGYGQWADSLWWTLNVIPGAISADEYMHLFNEMTILMMDEMIRNDWITFLHGNDITASWSSTAGAGMTGGTTAESLDAILNSLSGGTGSGSYGTSSGSSSGGSDFFWGLGGDWDMDGGFSRKRRSAHRQKRAIVDKMAHVALVGNCGNNVKPSISITANEQNVKMSLLTQNIPAELEIPLIQGWNEVTMVYDGKNLHGTVQNWQGKKHKKTPLTGNIVQRKGLTFGACDKYPRFAGQLDDILLYNCVPLALKKEYP
uniref:BMSP n=1 Tax=Mytilus galloprovincialis TaxID=29158 RepID=G1UCX0_MYTGA|nr:BMSP [Mytilus galloprovincialis]